MQSPPSIIILIPYFGKWPFWIPFFLESCAANSDINWLLISDCPPLKNMPFNVRQHSISFADYCAFVSNRLDVSFYPQSPYKLCDLKPALGFLHEADITGYDFWGFGDLDVIYGDLRAYFTADRLRRYRLLSTHERRVSGHFCLLRNDHDLNRLFWKIPDFVKRIEDPKHHALDEGGFTRLFLWRKNFPKPLFSLVGMFNRWRRVAEFNEAFSTPNGVRPWTDGTQLYPAWWSWESGRLSNSKDGARQFPYLHFLVWKKGWAAGTGDSMSLEQAQDLAAQGAWRIDEDGFHTKDVS